MKISKALFAALFILCLGSSCAALSRPGDSVPEKINWREYNDC